MNEFIPVDTSIMPSGQNNTVSAATGMLSPDQRGYNQPVVTTTTPEPVKVSVTDTLEGGTGKWKKLSQVKSRLFVTLDGDDSRFSLLDDPSRYHVAAALRNWYLGNVSTTDDGWDMFNPFRKGGKARPKAGKTKRGFMTAMLPPMLKQLESLEESSGVIVPDYGNLSLSLSLFAEQISENLTAYMAGLGAVEIDVLQLIAGNTGVDHGFIKSVFEANGLDYELKFKPFQVRVWITEEELADEESDDTIIGNVFVVNALVKVCVPEFLLMAKPLEFFNNFVKFMENTLLENGGLGIETMAGIYLSASSALSRPAVYDLYKLLIAKSFHSNLDVLSGDDDEEAESAGGEQEGEGDDDTYVGLELDEYPVIGLTKRPLGSPFSGYLPSDKNSLDAIFGDSETLFVVSVDKYLEALEDDSDGDSDDNDTDTGTVDQTDANSDREKLLMALEESAKQAAMEDSSNDDDDVSTGDQDSSDSTDVDENEIGEGDDEDDVPPQVVTRPRPVVGTLSLPSGRQSPSPSQQVRQQPVQQQPRQQVHNQQGRPVAYQGQPNRHNR